MEDKPTASLEKIHFQNFTLRLGKIFFNLGIVFLVLCICGSLSYLSTALLFLIGVIVTILTVGFIFLIAPDFWSTIISSMDGAANFAEFIIGNAYIFLSIAIVLSALSIVICALDKNSKHIARIVVASIVLAASLLMIILVASVVVR